MTNQAEDKKKQPGKEQPALKPDPGTLNTPDPQEEMKGPVSSVMQNIREEAEENNAETKKEADEKKDKNL